MSKLTTDKHEASRGLSATAELLVLLTRPTSLHYLVKRGCSKFLPNTGFITVRLLRFGIKEKRVYCRDNFLAQRPQLDIRRMSQGQFFVFQKDDAPAHREHNTAAYCSERDVRDSSSKRSCPCMRGTFPARILTNLS